MQTRPAPRPSLDIKRIPLQATIFANRNGSPVWTFDLVGIFQAAAPELRDSERQMLFHHDYFDEGRDTGQGTVGWYVERVTDPAQAARVAQAIDRQFANAHAHRGCLGRALTLGP